MNDTESALRGAAAKPPREISYGTPYEISYGTL